MLVTIRRERSSSQCTIGELTVNEITCCTLELPYHPVKVKGDTRIPAGQYLLKLRTEGHMHQLYTERFGAAFHKGMLWLQDVPDFEDVYIHIGNYPKDTLGCVLVGLTAGEAYVASSQKAYEIIYPIIASAIEDGVEVLVDVIDGDSR